MPYDAQTLFIRLLTLVDDFGRYDADFRLLRSHAFPYGDPMGREIKISAVERMCEFLSIGGMATFYKVGDKQVLQLERWNEKVRALESKYPPKKDASEHLFASVSNCSPSSPSPSPLHPRQSPNGSQANTSEPSDEEWIAELAKSKAYQGIDVPREFSKMEQWCKTARKNPSRRRFINWLNKCERPIKTSREVKPLDPSKIELPERFKSWAGEKYHSRKEEIMAWKTWADVPGSLRQEWWREEKTKLPISV